MLTIPLARLEQEGSLEIRAAIPPDHPSWQGTKLRFASPLSVSGKVQWLTSGEVLARVALRGVLAYECRRCLDPLEVPMEEESDLLFAPSEESQEGDHGSTRLLPPGVVELDLAVLPSRKGYVAAQTAVMAELQAPQAVFHVVGNQPTLVFVP